MGADGGLPLSDHADYTQLLSYIEECNPRKIYTLHGEARFAELLCDLGYDAEYLTKGFRSDQVKAPVTVSLEPSSRESSESLPAANDSTIGPNYELF